MKVRNLIPKAIRLLLALMIALPGLVAGLGQAEAASDVWRDITGNAAAGVTSIAIANDKLYLLYKASKKIVVREKNDSSWSELVTLPNQISVPAKLLVKGSDMYVIDEGVADSSSSNSKIFKSSDNGQNWAEINGPPGGYVALNAGADVLQSMFFDTTGNFYALSSMYLSKFGTNNSWSQVGVVPEDSNYSYLFTSAAADINGKVYASVLKTNKTNINDKTNLFYSLNGSTWSPVTGPLAWKTMQFTGGSNGRIYIAHADSPNNGNMTPVKDIYSYDGSSYNLELLTDDAAWTSKGIVFDGSYFYIASADKIRTSNPNFWPAALTPPATWYNITSNLDVMNPMLSVDQAVYAGQLGTKGVYYRNVTDTEWKFASWPQSDFGTVFSFVARSGNWYAADITTTGMMSPSVIKIRTSADHGVTWATYELPSSYTIAGALNPLVVGANGAVYMNDGKNIFKLGADRTWSQISVPADAGGFSFAYTGVAVNGSNELYANIRKYSPLQPLNNTAKLYKYNEATLQWGAIADSPSASMQLYTDSDNGMHAATSIVMNGETPRAYMYRIDDTGFSDEATLDSLSQARYGMAYGNGYYYILDADTKTIRTTNPNFSTGLTPPVLTADATDNDTAHALELTFADDAAWRAAITDVTVTKGGTVANAVYNVGQGTLTLTGLNIPGTYEVKVKASGYHDAVINQQVNLTPSTWYNITSDLDATFIGLSVNQAVYAAQFATTGVYYRNVSDIEWKFVSWPQSDFGAVFSFIARSGKWYVADSTSTGMMTPSVIKVHISSDQGATWSTYELPSTYTFVGALNPLAVGADGAVYMNDGKNIFKLGADRAWSRIPVPADAGGSSFAYTGIAVNGSNVLYASIRKYNPLQPLNNTAKLYKYNEAGPQWAEIADSPSASMQLYTDSDNVIHAATFNVMNGETPRAYMYRVDDTGFTDEATLDSLGQARNGMAYGNGYYYILDADGKTIRTTNPNFSTGLTPPVLTPDTTNNDDVHPLELAFDDNADWRSNVTNVTVKKDDTVVSADYQLVAGALKFPQALPAGSYTIEVTAAGYKKATVQQTVLITAPVLVADTSNNDTIHEITVTFADNVKWRESLTSVVYNGSTADSSKYRLSAGQLVFTAGYLPVGDVNLVVQAAGYPDASVIQTVKQYWSSSSSSSPGSASTGTSSNREVIKVDVLGGSRTGDVVSQVEIVRTTDEKGRKTDEVSFTAELAARAVEMMKSSGAAQAVIVIPDAQDEVSAVQVSLPRQALEQLTGAGIGLVIETSGATINIPAASLAASSGDLYFHVVPIKDAALQKEAGERAIINSGSVALQDAVVVGRPMTIETNLQAQPVTLTLPLGSFSVDQIGRLRIYIEHSDGTTEWLKGEPAVDDSGAAAIRFTVTKFSTFTIIDTASSVSRQAYMFGYEDGTFRPEQVVTRGQMAAILSRLLGGAAAKAAAPSYEDKAQFPEWAAGAIGQVSALGLMDGYDDGTFQADRAVTRAEAAAIVARLAKPGNVGQAASFTDTRGHWAVGAIDTAARAGLLTGYEDGSFVPDRKLSRAEAVTLINRLIERSAPNSGAPLWSDVPAAHWAFGDIQAASSIAP
ncbi:hemoblobin-interacting domain-containing protein [Paenibacillus thalictri]|uniref:DUF1533 domain-containing protein n=1 Tax=Paenibacillus thalictri TaxID=2527873 RepID=A0A4Q9DFM2_9BACL|nr:S-layer homology domain-containing protein [Paenibacillus thalictri]TBL70785.1 DUF1533 domain-containing protein [Paenibacillus thalictri]